MTTPFSPTNPVHKPNARVAALWTFWEALASSLAVGVTLLDALGTARTRLADTPLVAAVDSLSADVGAGLSLSDAVARLPDVFPRVVVAIVRAAEAAGTLDAGAAHIAGGLIDGSLDPAQPRYRQHYWWALGHMLSSGVPLLTAVDLLRESAADGRTQRAFAAALDAIVSGQPLAPAFRPFADIFPQPIIDAVARAEAAGNLDEAALAIGDALKSGNLAGLNPPGAAPASAPVPDHTNVPADAAAARAVNALLLAAHHAGASDVHLDPVPENPAAARVRFRIDGVLQDVAAPESPLPALLARLKTIAGMDPAERRLPQDGRCTLNINDEFLDCRVASFPAFDGERLVLHMLPRKVLAQTLNMFLDPELLEPVRQLTRLRQGLVLCTGPAGTGKTTSMYAMILEMDRAKRSVMTIEDPVEFRIPDTVQTQLQPQIGLTYSRALRHILRQDPDVIVIGEIRDLETLAAAATASAAGHLVLSQLHTNSAAHTIRRILDVGLEAHQLNVALAGILSQRLARALCRECKQPTSPDFSILPAPAAAFLRDLPAATFYAPKGCPKCRQTGYLGRVPFYQLFVPTETHRQLIATNPTLEALQQATQVAGLPPLFADGLTKAAAGRTDLAEMLRTLPNPMNL